MRVTRDYTSLIACGRQHELDKNIEEAIQCYKEAIAQEPVEEFPFNRLMVLYRKEKNYEEELKVVEKGIAVFKAFYDKRSKKYSGKNKLGQISKLLLKNLSKGETGMDGYPEPLQKWSTRKSVLEQKIGKQSKRRKKARK